MVAYSGFFETNAAGNVALKADVSGEVDMWWAKNAQGNVEMRTTALDPTFPAEDDTLVRAGLYGWAGEYTPDFTLPTDPTGDVRFGRQYGANGTEFTGTLIEGLAAPTLTITDAADGSHATATITGSTPGTTNSVYTKPRSYGTWELVGTRTGDGDVLLTITGGIGGYYGYVHSVLTGNDSYSAWVEFTITNPSDFREVSYRVVGIDRIPGTGKKRLRILKIEKPLAHGE